MRSLLLVLAGAIAGTVSVAVAPRLFESGRGVGDGPAAAAAGEDGRLRFVTEHKMQINGKTISYTATAGETFLADMSGRRVGSVFAFSYVKDDPVDRSRPVLFVFNGGPGSSSLWLHMGAIGPRRVVLDSEVNPSNVPPFGVAENSSSVLDVADIVFVDPIGTGFSRAVGAGKAEDFWGVDEDANAVAQFVELWITENGRWNSPKFLMGESYGSIRAAVLPRALMGGPFYAGVMRGITVNGVMLLGTTLGARAPSGAPDADDSAMRAALELPGYASTAWFHGKIDRSSRSPEAVYEQAAEFAMTAYLDALKKGESLSAEERAAVVEELAGYTGLPLAAFDSALVVDRNAFGRMLLAEEGLIIGQYDSRYTLPAENAGNDPVADDPAMGRYVPGFIAAFHQMLRDDLEVELDRPYGAIVWRDLLQSWNWKRGGVAEGQSYATDLAWAMRRNPDLRVMVASGYYDLVTTAADTERQIREAGLPADRVSLKIYESGHMLYLGDTAAAFADDVRAFIKAAQ